MNEQDGKNKMPPQPAKRVNPSVDLTMEQARTKTIRSTVGFMVIILAVLGISAWVAYLQEVRTDDKYKKDPSTNALLSAVSNDLQSIANNSGYAFKPQIADLPKTDEMPTGDILARMDPEVMAKAIGEVRIGKQYLQSGDLGGAEEHALKALEIWPGISSGQRLLGMVYIQRGQFDQAIAILEKELVQDPFNPETFNNLATAYMQKKMFDKAEDLLSAALQVQPGFAPALFNMGLISLMGLRFDAAVGYLQDALERQPQNTGARNNLAVALVRIGRIPDARKEWQTIMDRQPDMSAAYFNMALTYVLESQLPEAMSWVRMGAERSTLAECKRFLDDPDFNPIRNTAEFQQFLATIQPAPPTLPPRQSPGP